MLIIPSNSSPACPPREALVVCRRRVQRQILNIHCASEKPKATELYIHIRMGEWIVMCGQKKLQAIPVNKEYCPTIRPLRRGFGMEKSRTLAPDSWGADQWNDFNEPRLLHLPIHRKALNSLTWDVCFLWLAVIFWCSTTCLGFLFVFVLKCFLVKVLFLLFFCFF